ncbi:MAG: CRISPR-associated endonuclease Cas2 [Candidatus Wildermuthbacteria bacterium]|nr:CRISPR-associated endonuclease Cas2 [Candidatus Wildermuthbacteria bacterium]
MEHTYYFKKPRGEIVKDIFKWLMVGGVVAVAATSPTFLYDILRGINKSGRYKKHSVVNAFARLRKEGLIAVQEHNHQIYVSLTDEGRKRAGRFQIDSLSIKNPKKWDKKWRMVIFDIPNKKKMVREALRGLLIQLQFYRLQESVWVHPFDCADEVKLLKNFFGLTAEEMQLIIAEKIENQSALSNIFRL